LLEGLIMEKGYLPNKQIQWAYYVEEADPNNIHSSISSQDLQTSEKHEINESDEEIADESSRHCEQFKKLQLTTLPK